MEFAAEIEGFIGWCINKEEKLTQLTTGGRRDAEIATPINGPAEPCNKATATPLPEVKAHKTPTNKLYNINNHLSVGDLFELPIQRLRALPLNSKARKKKNSK